MSTHKPVIAKLIPRLIQSRIAPVWLVVALVATQVAINVASQSNNPLCRIDVQGVHQSRHEERTRNVSEAKVKVATECDVPQESTSLTVVFEEEIAEDKFTTAKNLTSIVAYAELPNLNYILIKNILTPCDLKGTGNYRARAYGKIRLKDGRIESISGTSQVINTLNCRISAK